MKARLIIAGVLATVATLGSASAADLGRPMYTKAPPAPPPPPVFSWTGFYFGLNVGGKWARVDDSETAAGTAFSFNNNTASSVIGGGQLGYNWQAPGSPWVFGIEGDVDAQDFHRDFTFATDFFPFVAGDSFSVESHWEASLRGRIGYAVWDRGLLYATGGVAWTQVKATANLVGLGSFSTDRTRTGATVGGGYEYALTDNISLGVEGRYTWYGHENFNDGNITLVNGTVLPVSNNVKFNTAEVLGKINFRFW